MTPNPRQAELLDEVRSKGSVSVEALAERFEVTLQTVRRDVKLLSDLADHGTGLEGMKLSRFDRILGLTRERIDRVYRGVSPPGTPRRLAEAWRG